ncbi:MAG: ferrous iron transport protein A [Gammaproteobacteria bacterium]|nr:ferrous iron transport protein A [Gammaproteobacteria bacterium]
MTNKLVTLSELAVGERVKIAGFHKGQAAYRNKLLSMGLTLGCEFTLTRIAPLGDPIEIAIRNFSLVLRKSEANLLKLERVTA